MTRITVVYHSGYGHTQRMAQAVADGANAELLAIDPDGNLPPGAWEQLEQSDAILPLPLSQIDIRQRHLIRENVASQFYTR